MSVHVHHDLDEARPWRLGDGLSSDAPLSVAIALFLEHLATAGAPANTLGAFGADLRRFAEVVGGETPLGSLAQEHVGRFLSHLQSEEAAPCSGRTLRRRMTALQAFLRHLSREGVNVTLAVPRPEARAPGEREVAPLLGADELGALTACAAEMAADAEPRALLLLSLSLSLGASKADVVALHAADFDLHASTVRLGHGLARRVVALPGDARQALLRYLESGARGRGGSLFGCTGRNLEYILARLAERAGLRRRLSFRLLRTTAAARMYQAGDDEEAIVRRLGISPSTWPALRRRVRAAQVSAREEG